MCGIFSLLNHENQFSKEWIEEQFQKGVNRGPEFSTLTRPEKYLMFGFHRLAINGLNPESNQPIEINNGSISLICNGEIYNYKELYSMMNITPNGQSDCEVIVHLYKRYGIEHTIQMLDGVFSFMLYDHNTTDTYSKLYICRDPYGVRPLYILKPAAQVTLDAWPIYAFASEIKVLSEFCVQLNDVKKKYNLFRSTSKSAIRYTVDHFTPGTYSEFRMSSKVSSHWTPVLENVRYSSLGFNSTMFSYDHFNNEDIIQGIQTYLVSAVNKRCLVTERPVACLLSGGLDSSLITALVNEFQKKNGSSQRLETYSIGLENSVDLYNARIVAEYLDTNHTEIVLTEQDFLDAIPEVIRAIESYDTTTVRASIGNYLIGKYISKHSDAKVIFNGDGSDELTGGYLYMSQCQCPIEFDKESRRLLRDIHAFDVLRSDKSISSHGLEPRTPFLDRSWVNYYLSISPAARFRPAILTHCEKYLLRSAFIFENYSTVSDKALLPESILWRQKEAFSDGVSGQSRSLFQIIQEHVDGLIEDTEFDECAPNFTHNRPTTKEQYYYRKIFEEYYPGLGNVVPYFWMPKYVDAKDASARTLTFYKPVATSAL